MQGSMQTPVPKGGLSPYTKKLLLYSFTIGIIPPIVLVAAMASKSLFLLDYVHVITGATWTGFDIFMGVVMTRIMRLMEIPQRVEVAKRLTPTTFFIMPSLGATAITAGIYLAQRMGIFNLSSPWIMAAGVIVLILVGQAFGVFLPNGIRIFLELAKTKPDVALIAKLNLRNVRLAGSQAIFQLLLILVMAHFATM